MKQFGPYECDLISDGRYRLDGGAMFGVVPKVMWERKHEPDEANRIILALNSLLARSDERTILVDCGLGDIWSDADVDLYGIERPDGGLLEDLARKGVQPGDVTDVVLKYQRWLCVEEALYDPDLERYVPATTAVVVAEPDREAAEAWLGAAG